MNDPYITNNNIISQNLQPQYTDNNFRDLFMISSKRLGTQMIKKMHSFFIQNLIFQ
jgi:hypothetical protein